ncbi:MAG: O-antigen ligase family protein [Acidobacteriota bacterium]
MSSSPSAPTRAARVGFWLYAGHLLTIWGIALANVFLGLLLLWTAWRRRLGDWSAFRRQDGARAVWLATGALAVLYLLSTLLSLDPARSASELGDLLAWSTFALAPVWVAGEERARRLVVLFLGLATLLALHGVAQYLWTDLGGLHDRIIGLFSHYQTFAGVLLIGFLAAVARVATGRRDPWTWVAVGLLTVCLLLTLTRGAWVAAVATVLGLALARARHRPARSAAVVALIVAAIGLLVTVGPGSWRERIRSIGDLSDLSNYDRLCMIEAAGYMVAERPLFGIGPEMVAERYPIYRHPTAPRVTTPHLHNAFVSRAAELGLLTSIAYLIWIGALVALAWRGYRAEGGRHGPRADLWLATLLVAVGFNIAGLFEDNWRDTEVRRAALFLLALPLCLNAERSRSTTPESLVATSSAERDPVWETRDDRLDAPTSDTR